MHRNRIVSPSFFSILFLLAGGLLAAPRAAAQPGVPGLLSYQGVLSDPQRVAVPDGQYNVTFRIYDAETGGRLLWEESADVQTESGVFDVILGTKVPLTLPFDASYWFALELQGEPEMTPRVRFVSTPYAFRALNADTARQLDANAADVVHTLNGLDGRLTLEGEGLASVTVAGNAISVVVPPVLPADPEDGQTIRWNAAAGIWEAAAASVSVSPRLAGDGSPGGPLDIAGMGAADGQPLVWNAAAGAWEPGEAGVNSRAPLRGDGSTADPLGLEEGESGGQILFWDGTAWRLSAGAAPQQGETLIWDAAGGTWIPAAPQVVSAEEIAGTGTAADPLRLARQGAAAGQVLRWDDATGGWRPGPFIAVLTPPLGGSGAPGDPIKFIDGDVEGQLLFWDGATWKRTVPVAPSDGELLRWNAAAGAWEPAGIVVSNRASLSRGAMWYGDAADTAAELPLGAPDQVMVVNREGTFPVWSDTLNVAEIDVRELRVEENVTVGRDIEVTGKIEGRTLEVNEDAVIGGDLTVNGSAVTLPAGSVDNSELVNSTIDLSYGTGLSGDATVSLGGTLSLQNTGVTEAQAGAGISVDQTTGAITITNTGVTSLTGTSNRVLVDQSTGDVVLSTPQDIHTDATPRFDGITLDNLTPGSTSSELLVTNGGAVESRSLMSLHPGGVLPAGSAANTTLRWDGSAWVENTGVTADANGNVTADGDLTVNGSAVTLPSASIDNGELANSTIDLVYGTGLSGDVTASLGGTLNLQNTGVTEAQAGAGISVDQSTGAITITNTGVTSLTGTTNRVLVDQSTGDIVLSTPQDIHTDATPTFDGITLDNLTSNSASTELLVTNGGSVQSRTVASLSTAFESEFWTTDGNTGTTAGTDFVGTTDDEPFEIHVDNANSDGTNGRGRVMRFEPNNSSANIIGGFKSNSVASGVVGSVIAGGGRSSGVQSISGDYGTVGGGYGNLIETGGTNGTISGGINHKIRSNATGGTIGGGTGNEIRSAALNGTIGGGYQNIIDTSAVASTIGGGRENLIDNTASQSVIGGGYSNDIGSGAYHSTIAGGYENAIGVNARWSTIGGGEQNSINALSAVIAGGTHDTVETGAQNALIVGGDRNYIRQLATFSIIVGGRYNEADTGADWGFIGGGELNVVDADNAVIAGGRSNRVAGNRSAIAGGRGLTLSGSGSFGFLGNNAGSNDMSLSDNNIAVFGNTDLWLANNDNGASALRFYESNSVTGTFPGTANYSSFEAGSQSGDIRYILPDTAGIAGDVLTVRGVSGTQVTLDWSAGGSGSAINVSDSAWGLTGNAGTTAGTDFVGTTDDEPFQIHVDNANSDGTNGRGRVMRFEPNSTSANIIGGFKSNSIASGVVGSVIAGGGRSSGVQSVSGDYGTVGGGYGNLIETGGTNGTISGGINHKIRSNATGGTIGGGTGNEIRSAALNGTIGGGYQNIIDTSAVASTIGGGRENLIDNTASQSVIGGGYSNNIGSGAYHSTIAGGYENAINARWSTIGGGEQNSIDALSAVIAGGTHDTVESGAQNAFIGGGDRNHVRQAAIFSAIVGGRHNEADTGATWGFIGGGELNVLDANDGVIAGGRSNRVAGNRSAIAGGRGLTLSGSGSFGFLGNNAGSNDMSLSDNNIAVFGNTDLWLANNDNGASALRFYESNSVTGTFPGTANYSSFEAGSQSGDIRYILPDTAGIAGDVLTVRGVSGTQVTLDWSAGGSGSTINVSDSAWGLAGNAGTTAGTDFVGTADDEPFEIHVDNANSDGTNGRGRVMRYEPNGTSPNILGGFQGNTITGGAAGGTISGGGANGAVNAIGGGTANTISGGRANTVSVGTDDAVISGGRNGIIRFGASYASVGGGQNNTIDSNATHGVIGGGESNRIGLNATWSTIGGGRSNIVNATAASITAGQGNTINSGGYYAGIGAGLFNVIGTGAQRGFIGGGSENMVNSGWGTVSGGQYNVVAGTHSAIPGGRGLTLSGNRSFGFLGGNTESNDMTVSAADVTVFGNTDVWLANNDNGASALRFYEANSTTGAFPGTANYTSFSAGAQTADIAYTLPAAAPTGNGQVLSSTAAGVMSWQRPNTLARTAQGANYAMSSTDIIVGATAVGITVTLPAANAVPAGTYVIIKDETGTASGTTPGTTDITVSASGTDTIDGAGTAGISTPYGSLKLYSDGVGAWFVM